MHKDSIKKLLILGLALMAVTCTMAAISADDVAVTQKTVENGTLTINGLQFKIPTGFTEVESDQEASRRCRTHRWNNSGYRSISRLCKWRRKT